MSDDTCDGYHRGPHTAPIVAELQRPNSKVIKLCAECYNLWQDSEEDFP